MAAPLLLLALLGCRAEEACAARAIQAIDGRLEDASGRGVLLRGLNARVEGLFDVTFDDGRVALETIPPFSGEDCRFMARELGHNLLRLPVNWSGLEPERGQYNEAYLEQLFGLVDDCYREGVYTLVDLHQDAYSKEIGEDGAPLWAIIPEPEELLEGPLEDLEERRLSGQVLDAFASFYANVDGLQDDYAAMSAVLVERFVDHPGAIGLELQNEPVVWGDQAALDDFHARVSEAIRAVDPHVLIAFEPDSLRNFTDEAPVGAPFPFENAVYAPHIYTHVFVDGWEDMDEEALADSVAAAVEEAGAHGAPLLVGEFGNDARTEHGFRFIEASLERYDEALASWAFWVYEEYSQDSWGLYDAGGGETRGALRGELADLLARPFPEAVDGRLTGTSWDANSRTLTVTLSDAGRGAHRFTAPARIWPSPISATCDGVSVEVALEGGRAELVCQGEEIVISD